MRRNARRTKKENNWWNDKKVLTGGSILAVAFAFAIGISAYTNRNDNNLNSQNIANENQIVSLAPENEIETNTESASTAIGNTIDELENTTSSNTASKQNDTSSNKSKYNTNTSIKNNTKTKKSSTATTNSKPEKKDVTFDWPIKGDIIKEFSTDNLLYSATLQEWTTHNGIDIKADKASVVNAASDGTVKSIKNDPRYGLTVTIEHSGGFKTVYSNLLTAEFVTEGEKVTKGQSIGTVGNTANFEVADDTHLHFEILKDNKPVSPTIYLK